MQIPIRTAAGKVGRRIKREIGKRWPRASIRAHSEMLWNLFPPSYRIRRLATGFRFTEGPVWLRESSTLLFSDIPASRIYALHDGTASVFRDPSNHSNGLTLDKNGRLIACEHASRRVTRTESDGSITVLADRYHGKRLNSPNDVIVGPDGSVYFTDPPYGIREVDQELPFQGVYRIGPSGEVELLSDEFDRPNGLALSPDGETLYVDDSRQRVIRAIYINGDQRQQSAHLFVDMAAPGVKGSPDGMKVDVEGNLYCTGPGGLWVLSQAGEHLGTILLPEQPSNCAWGGPENRTLFITAETSVYAVTTKVRGITTRDQS